MNEIEVEYAPILIVLKRSCTPSHRNEISASLYSEMRSAIATGSSTVEHARETEYLISMERIGGM